MDRRLADYWSFMRAFERHARDNNKTFTVYSAKARKEPEHVVDPNGDTLDQ